MTLRRKIGFQISAMIIGLLLVSFTALWGLNGLRQDYGVAAAGYEKLRDVYEVGSHLATARTLLLSERPDRAIARKETERATARFQIFADDWNRQTARFHPHDIELARLSVTTALADACRQFATPPEEQTTGEILPVDVRFLSNAIGKIGDLAAAIRQTIEANERSASHKHDVTTRAVATVSLLIVIAAAIVGVVQYRGVMSPLSKLRAGVRAIAAGKFTDRLHLNDGDEFIELAGEFNGMASELDGFYHQLEQKVAQKSKELIQSERLASLGYLAAGVAHEINNPLGIIAGYAEHSLEQLAKRKGVSAKLSAEDADMARSLEIICEEAFRCKDITSKLLSLARQDSAARAPVDLAAVAGSVIGIIGGLRHFADLKLLLETHGEAKLTILAAEAEMKQMLLNLSINALEASQPGSTVRICIRRITDLVELSVIDTGAGMTAETLDRIFEPFFTAKPAGSQAFATRHRGTGLGLSITRAIVESHGGTITATSDGPLRGSRFTVRLPAC